MILPVRDALDVVSGKWKIPILIAMGLGSKELLPETISRLKNKRDLKFIRQVY
jgi:DNA-binding HxlR family transcriptional regulator